MPDTWEQTQSLIAKLKSHMGLIDLVTLASRIIIITFTPFWALG